MVSESAHATSGDDVLETLTLFFVQLLSEPQMARSQPFDALADIVAANRLSSVIQVPTSSVSAGLSFTVSPDAGLNKRLLETAE
jgi:hypothetical protein